MLKNEKNINLSTITTESKENTITKNNIQILPQLEKDICILINYIRTNPLDFANNLIKNSKNKKLTEERIELIKFLEDKYNKEQLLPFQEIPEISEAAKNLLHNISQNDSIFDNKNKTKIKSSALNLRTRLSNYGLRTGRIFSNVIYGIENPEDIVNHILKDENGRNMLLSDKMKFIGIGCCSLPSNKICSVIDIVQDFMPFKKTKKKDNIFNNYLINNNKNKININSKEKKNENTFYPKMNIIINNTNNKYIPNIIYNKHSNQRKKNEIYENSNNNNENIFKTPNISAIDSNEQKSYKSYNIIINNNKIIPIKNNLSNITELNEVNKNKDDNENFFNLGNKNNKIELNIGFNSGKVGMNKSKSAYGFKYNTEGRGTSTINKYQKLNRKEKIEILHKINQRKNNNSMVKNSTKFENLIPLSPDYSKNKKKNNLNNKYNSPISPIPSKRVYDNLDSDSNNFEFNETMPNYQSPKLDNDLKINELKNDLIVLKKQLKEELKLEVKNEIKSEIKKELKDNPINNNNKINKQNEGDKSIDNDNKRNTHKRNFSKGNLIYHKRYKSDFSITKKNEKNSVDKNEINKKMQSNYQIYNNQNNLYIKDEHRIKNKNEIKKLIRLYNKEKDIKRNKSGVNKNNIIYKNNKITNNKISNFFFDYKSNIINNNVKNTNINNKFLKYSNDKTNIFLIKYQKAKPKDQAFKLTKNKSNIKYNKSELCLKDNFNKIGNKPIKDKELKERKNPEYSNTSVTKENTNDNNIYIINSYRNRSRQQKKMKELSIEEYLNGENYIKLNKKYKTPEKNSSQLINFDDIWLNSEDKKHISMCHKTTPYRKHKAYKI